MVLRRLSLQGRSWCSVVVCLGLVVLSAVPGMSATTVTLSPSSTLAFGTVPLGSSQTQQFTIKNSGPDTITNVAVSETGQFFALTSNCPATLTPGTQCT